MRIFTGLLLATWMVIPASAQKLDAQTQKLVDFANNFSHENTLCGVYSLVVHQCLMNKDAGDPLATQYRKLGNDHFNRAEQVGEIAGVSKKALSARSDLAIEDMKSEMENTCSNISILFKRYAKTCKSLYDNGPALLQEAVKRYQ